jgi:hypothetical protein
MSMADPCAERYVAERLPENGDAPLRAGSRRRVEEATRDLIGQLGAEFRAQFDCMGRELGQTQALLGDAIETLTSSFTAIHRTLDTFLRASEVGGESRATLEPLLAALAEEIHGAVRSLQFQDLTHQLLDHIASRLAEMHAVLNEIDAASEVSADFAEFLRLGREAVRRHEVVAEVRGDGPVTQGHVAAGDIDLF